MPLRRLAYRPGSGTPLPPPAEQEDDEALRQRAEGLGVRLGFLSEYASLPNPAYAHTLVVNYAGLDIAGLDEAEALLSEVFRP